MFLVVPTPRKTERPVTYTNRGRRRTTGQARIATDLVSFGCFGCLAVLRMILGFPEVIGDSG